MAKKVYIGINGVAKKVKKGYVGVNNVAKKIKKAYIGIAGVARPCWGGELAYYGAISSLSKARYALAATTIGNHALFGGGLAYAGISNAVDAYDSDLTRSTATNLARARANFSASTVGSYAIFGPGQTRDDSYGSTGYGTVDFYNSELVHSSATKFVRKNYGMTSVGNYAILAGGATSDDGSESVENTVYALNDALVQTTVANLSRARGWLSGTTIGNYAIFAGGTTSGTGFNSSVTNYVDCYSNALVKITTISMLSEARMNIAATANDRYALFAGGLPKNGAYDSNVVDTYSTELVKATATSLPTAMQANGAQLGPYSIFVQSISSSDARVPSTAIYDEDLALVTLDAGPNSSNLSAKGKAATTIGDYAVFAGGYVSARSGSSCYRSEAFAYKR